MSFRRQEPYQCCFGFLGLHLHKGVGWYLDARNQDSSFEEKLWKLWISWYFKTYSGFSDFESIRNWMRIGINELSTNYSSTIKKVSIETEMKVLIFFVLGEKWVSTSMLFITICTFWHSRNVGIRERYVPTDEFFKSIGVFWSLGKYEITDNSNKKAATYHFYTFMFFCQF